MKKLIFTILINGSFLLVNAQTNAEVIKGETLNCRTEQVNNLSLDENEKVINKNQNINTETTINRKSKKHFIKKVLSNFRSTDIKDAWSVVSIY